MFSPRSKSYKEQTYFPYGLNLSPGPGWQLTAFNFIYWFISPEQAFADTEKNRCQILKTGNLYSS